MSFLSKLEKTAQPRSQSGSIPVEFRYTQGVAGEKFFRALKDEGRILGTRCAQCAMTYVPGRLFCERCFAELQDWVDCGHDGELFSYTVTHVGLDGEVLAAPRVFGLIKLYHADTLLFHEVLASPDRLRIGMKLRAVLKPKNRRRGSITDLRGFAPRDAAPP